MDTQRIKLAISNGEINTVESLWMDGLDQSVSPHGVQDVLNALVRAEEIETAKMLIWTMMEAKGETIPPAELIELAKVSLLALPGNDDLRTQVVGLYEKVHSQRENFRELLAASGLKSGQSPRRAIRTLDTCLALQDGTFLANRFDHRVITIKNFDAPGILFHGEESNHRPISFEPKALADEFEIPDESDFRVLKHTDPDALKEMFKKDISRVLVGICVASGGRVTSDQLKEELVDDFIPASQWSRWWSRARTAAKRSEFLTIAGRSPVTIEYHADGLSLEEEFSGPLSKARTAHEHLEIVRAYIAQASRRKIKADEAEANAKSTQKFLIHVTDRLIQQVNAFVARRTDEAFEAALAIETISQMDCPKSDKPCPTASEILSLQKQPAESIASLTDAAFWPNALRALTDLDDAPAHLEKLLYLAPAAQIDAIAGLLNQPEVVDKAVVLAMTTPLEQLDLVIWAWNATDGALINTPRKIDLFARLIKALHEVIHSYQGPAEFKRTCQQKIRSAMIAADYSSYRQVIENLDESTAAVMKNRIERADGLAATIRDEMLSILRQSHYKLFLAVQIPPWLNEGIIWTTKPALDKRKEDYKYLNDVTILANAKQIGEAAAQGDLSENADWEAAIAERDMLKARANAMQTELSKARVIDLDEKITTVVVGSKIRITMLDTQKQMELTFLGPWDSDTDNNVFSYTTNLALQFMGKNLGEEVTAPIGGKDTLCRIDEIVSAV